MKALKISLAVIAVTAIAVGIYMWIAGINPPPPPPPADNQFTKRIEQEIDSLGKLPDSKFCKDFYKEVEYHIEDYYKSGRLGKNQSENDQWKENLSKNLYSAYADKFIKQAFYVFLGSEWKSEDLQSIRSEYQTLRKSSFLKRGSPVDNKFTEIQNIFSKYDEIAGFISVCKGFSYLSSGLTDRFPVSDVQDKISRAAAYRNNRLENGYVNNCTRLHDGLREIPQALFQAHVSYLNNKITQWSGLYSNYPTFNDYNKELGQPIQSEIDALDNDIYNVVNFDSEYKNLSDKWNADKKAAGKHEY